MSLSFWLRPLAPSTAPRALAWYLVIAIAFTWPLFAGLEHDIPRDLGDPLLNSWILGWNASHMMAALRGDPGVLADLWHGNIFHPEPYTLAYSELLLAPSIQILPIYAATGNLVLCYNLLFLSAYVLSGLGMFLLARAYTSDWRAAFVAGLLYAFAPYRVTQASHLQVMMSQWMPFVLFAFHRFVAARRLRMAVGGAVALVAQNLSCGYYLIFFAPFVPAFALFEIGRARAWWDCRVWTGFALAAVIVAAATLPAMAPYLALRDLQGSRRPLSEVVHYSADAWGWLSADRQLAFWGPRLQRWARPEGQLFPGALPVVLAIVGLAGGIGRAWRSTGRRASPPPVVRLPPRIRTMVVVSLAAAGIGTLPVAGLVFAGLADVALPPVPAPLLRLENHVILLTTVWLGLVLISGRARAVSTQALRSPLTFAAAAAAVAWYLSLGPVPRAGGQSIAGPPLYPFLLDHLPGMDGLRVAARFAMIVVLFLSLAAAWGVRSLLDRRGALPGALLVALLSTIWLAETWSAPWPMNEPLPSMVDGVANPPSRVPTGRTIPVLARFLRSLPDEAVVIEFPFAAGGWEMRYVYYSTLHWRRIVNGFSGYEPDSYRERARLLRDPYEQAGDAWDALLASGATHVVVHGQAYLGRSRPAPHDWLIANGARFLAQFGGDDVFEVPRP